MMRQTGRNRTLLRRCAVHLERQDHRQVRRDEHAVADRLCNCVEVDRGAEGVTMGHHWIAVSAIPAILRARHRTSVRPQHW
eukprot:4428815-Prymnesium_polylepis.1